MSETSVRMNSPDNGDRLTVALHAPLWVWILAVALALAANVVAWWLL